MRIVCPNCDAAYEVPAPVMAARRTLRCARCGTQFATGTADPPPPPGPAAGAEPAPAAPRVDDAPAPLRADAPAAPRTTEAPATLRADAPRLGPGAGQAGRAPRVRVAVLAGWVLSLALIVAGLAAALSWRQGIVRAWPASTRIYTALGYVS